MSPRTGRPIKGEERKDINLQLRITKTTNDRLLYCSEKLHTSRTEVIEQGIDIIYNDLKKNRELHNP